MTLETALIMQKKSKYQESARLYHELVQVEPQNVRARAGLALSMAAIKDYEQAQRAASQALELDKNSDYAHLALAIIAHAQGEKEKFVDEAERAFYVKPFVFDVACKYAQLLAEEKDILPAIPVFQKMIESDAAKECRNYLYGLAYYQLRRPKLAIKHSLIALKTDPSVKTFSLLLKVLLTMVPLVSIPLIFLFLASIWGVAQYGRTLSWYLFVPFLLTYVLSWGLVGACMFSFLGLIGQKKKRAQILLAVTIANIAVFLGILFISVL